MSLDRAQELARLDDVWPEVAKHLDGFAFTDGELERKFRKGEAEHGRAHDSGGHSGPEMVIAAHRRPPGSGPVVRRPRRFLVPTTPPCVERRSIQRG